MCLHCDYDKLIWCTIVPKEVLIYRSKIFNQPILALKARYPMCNLHVCIYLKTDFMAIV